MISYCNMQLITKSEVVIIKNKIKGKGDNMVLDSLKNAHLYSNLSERIAIGLKYLQEKDFSNVEAGKYEIQGSNVYAAVSINNSKAASQCKAEAHKKYIDIQYVVSGSEKISYNNISDMIEASEYNEMKDVQFYRGVLEELTVKPGYFAIFFPEDVHMPGIVVDEPLLVKKVVVKIAL